MFQILSRFRRGSKGQGLVEFALILPMLAFVMFAFWELSRGLNTYQTITRAAREAARTYVVANGINTQAQIDSVANFVLASSALDPGLATITHENGLNVDVRKPYAIRIDYPFDFFLLRAIYSLRGGSAPWQGMTLSRRVEMLRE